jgi:putative membrane protein
MFFQDALLAYLHFLALIGTVATVVAEAVLCRPGLDERRLKVLGRVDLWYLVMALLALASGFGRAIWGLKGWAFYANNPVFWVKIGLFVLVGLLSIVPTIRFIRWAKTLAATPGTTVADGEVKAMSRYIVIELGLLALIPLMAVLMSRGFGY